MPKISIECTPEEVVELFQKAGPAQAEMMKAMLNLLAENPEMVEKLGAANAAYFKGAAKVMLGTDEKPAPLLPVFEMLNPFWWMPKN